METKYSCLFTSDGGETITVARTKAHGPGELTKEECNRLFNTYVAKGWACLWCPVGGEQHLAMEIKDWAKRGIKTATIERAKKRIGQAIVKPVVAAVPGRYAVTVKIATQFKPGVCGYSATVTCKGTTHEISDVLTEKATNRRAAVIALSKALQLVKKDNCDVTVMYGKPEQLGPVEYAAEHDGKTRTGKLSANAEEILTVAPDLRRLNVTFVEDEGEVGDVRAKANKLAGDTFAALQNAEQDSASEQTTDNTIQIDVNDKAPWDEDSNDSDDDGTFMPF